LANTPQMQDDVVSFDDEQLILVDDNDHEIGFEKKDACHQGQGTLHRAFSLFIFNDAGELLLQQRSASKRLWPLYWSNSCCSHPRRGETMAVATQRRLYQELGLRCDLDFVYKFQYHAQFDAAGAERELCWVYLGKTNHPVQVNKTEVAGWRFITPADLVQELHTHPDHFSPWFKLEWQRLNSAYQAELERFTQPCKEQ